MSAADKFLYSGASWATNAMPSSAAGDATRGRRRQADRQVQQRALAGAVGADQRDHVTGGDRQRALAQRPGAAVALAEAACLQDVHATSFVSPL
jgi:hypothetical protein